MINVSDDLLLRYNLGWPRTLITGSVTRTTWTTAVQ
jgi:hypothetical protein